MIECGSLWERGIVDLVQAQTPTFESVIREHMPRNICNLQA